AAAAAGPDPTAAAAGPAGRRTRAVPGPAGPASPRACAAAPRWTGLTGAAGHRGRTGCGPGGRAADLRPPRPGAGRRPWGPHAARAARGLVTRGAAAPGP